MNFRVRKMIEKLEQGHEFCGVCGKDVTNAPECMHSNYMLQFSTSCQGRIGRTLKTIRNFGTESDGFRYEDTLFSHRIGCEMLLDTGALESLVCFDPYTQRTLYSVSCYRYLHKIAYTVDNPTNESIEDNRDES